MQDRVPATTGHSPFCSVGFFGLVTPDGLGDFYLPGVQRGLFCGRDGSISTELRFNLQRFIDAQYVLLLFILLQAPVLLLTGSPCE